MPFVVCHLRMLIFMKLFSRSTLPTMTMDMLHRIYGLCLLVAIVLFVDIDAKRYHRFGDEKSPVDSSLADRRLLVDVDIYNRPYTLPYILRQLEQLTCPCGQCYLDLRVYHVFNTSNEHETSRFVDEWVTAMETNTPSTFTKITVHQWSAKSVDDRARRLDSVMKRSVELDVTYLAMFDSMIILLEPDKLLSILISKDKPLMTPLLRSTKDMFTSTFYLNDQKSSGYHAYLQIYDGKQLGCFLIDGGIKDFYFFNFHYQQVRERFLIGHSFDDAQQYGRLPTDCRRSMIYFVRLPSSFFFRYRHFGQTTRNCHVCLQSRNIRLHTRTVS
jgi:hypothetical protein